MSGNAWVNNDRSGRDAPQYGPGQEQHVPLNGFNTQDESSRLQNPKPGTRDQAWGAVGFKAYVHLSPYLRSRLNVGSK
ncbi:MAG: hypothetical protein Q9179_000653 [Wetmoreana sp. 5 TL-2023]